MERARSSRFACVSMNLLKNIDRRALMYLLQNGGKRRTMMLNMLKASFGDGVFRNARLLCSQKQRKPTVATCNHRDFPAGLAANAAARKPAGHPRHAGTTRTACAASGRTTAAG